MTEINNNKFVPQAQTYEVRYLWQEQQKPKLSLAARQKIINYSGGNYVSERSTIINPNYGPGFWDDVVRPVGKAVGAGVGAALFVAAGPVAIPIAATAVAGGYAQKKLAEASEGIIPEPARKVMEFHGDNAIAMGSAGLSTIVKELNKKE